LLHGKPRRAAIVSLHFSYPHISHMSALANLLRALGFATTFILDEKYPSNSDLSLIGDRISADKFANNSGSTPFEVAFYCNSAVNNHILARAQRKKNTKVFYLFHEPESVWNIDLLRSEGAMKMLRFLVSSYYSARMVRQCSDVIVFSTCALSLYKKNYLRYNRNVHMMPLPFEDEVGPARLEQSKPRKRYFGFVGTACKAHGFVAFVKVAKYAARNGSNIPFVIATSVDLTSLLHADKELADLVKQERILVQHGRKLSNEEINQYYLDCFCIWNVYLRSTQSGVLPRSFMAGTPVLASRVGSFPEDVFPGLTGEFANADQEPATILAIMERMRAHTSDYVDVCRKRFMEKYHDSANRFHLADILRSAAIADLPQATERGE